MSTPDISVIIPLYNREHLVVHTLDSLSPDRHPGVQIEVLVVDDGSSDGGPALVERDYPYVWLLRQPNLGAAAARNHGLASARAEAVLFLDSDDLIEPEFFPPRLDALAKHPAADGSYGPWDAFSSDAGFSEADILPPSFDYPVEKMLCVRPHLLRLLRGWFIAPHAVLWRTSALRRVSGHDVGLSINQDIDLMFRLLISGAGIVGCSAPRSLYRAHLGVRQGAIGTSRRKAENLLNLRLGFIRKLEDARLYGEDVKRELGFYCFSEWERLRNVWPDIAEDFYRLSRELFPDYQLDARWSLRMLAQAIGPKRTVLFRDRFRFLPDAYRGFAARRAGKRSSSQRVASRVH
jgi:glycosyltransferase involved in cell wall biosynthesis